MLSAARIPTGTLRCAQRDRVPFAVVPENCLSVRFCGKISS